LRETGGGRSANDFDDAHQIAKHLIIREAKHHIALRMKPRVSILIVPLARLKIV
jgi:hypothetical protein